ncbi:MAG: PHP-associated domain-containing protein [Planctomycetota bacterium]
MRVDLHVHTGESEGPPDHWLGRLLGVHESYTQPEEAVGEALRKGLDAVAISNHDTAGDSLRLARARPESVIAACEYRVYGGRGYHAHVVVLGITERHHERLLLERHRGIGRFTGLVRSEGLVCFLAHPAWVVPSAGPGGQALRPPIVCEWLEHFDLVETLNGHSPAENEVASGLARYFGKARVGGSDAHEVSSVGMCWTEADADSVESFLERLRAGECRSGGEAADTAHFASAARSLLGTFYRRELMKAVGAGSFEKYVAGADAAGFLKAVGETVILPGLFWGPTVGSDAYLKMLRGRADDFRRRLVDHLALRLSRSMAIEDLTREERERRWTSGMREIYAAFGAGDPAVRVSRVGRTEAGAPAPDTSKE